MIPPIDLATIPTAPFDPTKAHSQLALLAGAWEGTTTTRFDPSAPAEESRTRAHVQAILGGRFLRIQYTGTVSGAAHAGEMLFAYEKDEQRYSLAWVDSFHTGTALMHSTGDVTAPDGPISVLGSYGAGGQRWGWRTTLHASPERLVLEAFNVAPDGQEDPAVKTVLERA